MGLFQRFKKDKGGESLEETTGSGKFVELLNKNEVIRDAFTILSDIYGGEVISDLTTPILEASLSPDAPLDLDVTSSPASWLDEWSFHQFNCAALAEGGRVHLSNERGVKKFKKAFNLSDLELSIVIDSTLIIMGTILPPSQYGPFAKIANKVASQRRKKADQKR